MSTKRPVQPSMRGYEPIPKKSALIKTDKPRPHICATCTRGFARLEHLKRHERSHTNEKPFQCAACGRCFARRDLVLRHQQKLHSLGAARDRESEIITKFGNKEVSLPTKVEPRAKSSLDDGEVREPPSLFQRHNSFSATSPRSYTRSDKSGDIESIDGNPEGPHQVGFSTPQLSATELTAKALESGLDLQALGLQFGADEFALDREEPDYFSLKNEKKDSTAATPLFNLTPGGSLLEPALSEYLHVGTGGGGAGFAAQRGSNINLTMFQHSASPAMTSHNHSTNTDTSTSIHDDNMSPEDWLGEFINTPFEQNFGTNKKTFNSIGFVPSISPSSSGAHSQDDDKQQKSPIPSNQLFNNDISQMFRTRQIDLFKKVIENKDAETELPLFTLKLRQHILEVNKLSDTQFPSLAELNQYTTLYQNEFDKYFPFIHLPTLTPSLENYPVLLSIASVGALYAFHSGHALLMFNVARYRIHAYLEHEKTFKHNSNIPVWLYQSMVLLIFIGIFNNDLSVTKTMTIFLNSLIELVKLTSLNLPLESLINPPPVMDNLQNSSEEAQRANFDYFILAQSRIRTCHTILLISNLFSSLVGLDCSLHSLDLKSGVHCKWDELWLCRDYSQWMNFLEMKHYVIDSKFALVELSNGNDSYTNCLNFLTLSNYILSDDDHSGKSIQMKTLLSLLMSIHEKIYLERSTVTAEPNGVIAATKWRMTSRPVIESLIKSWESLYIQNGGVFHLNETSLSVIYNKNPILRLILPLLSFAKIRKCIHLTPIMEKIWKKDWEGMNEEMQKLRNDPEALRDSTNYALDIVKLWIDYVSIHNDAEKTSIRTPVFFITCIFTSLLIIAEFLLSVEKWAQHYDDDAYLSAIERTLWLRSQMVFKRIEECLILDDNNKTYAEFLRIEAKGALDVETLDDELAKHAIHPNTDVHETRAVIQEARLSSRGLYLGVRILGDAPIWPIALLFAQALKARAIHISKSQPPTPAGV